MNPQIAASTPAPAPTPGIRYSGTIRSLKEGFGFVSIQGQPTPCIAPNGECFFHKADLPAGVYFGSLNLGDALTFEIDREPKGPRAVRIVLDTPTPTR